MTRFLRFAGLAVFCVAWGFVGSLGAVWLLDDQVRGEAGPIGPRGSMGLTGPSGPAGPTLSGAYVIADPLVGSFGCPDGSSPELLLPRAVLDSSGNELRLCRID